MPGSVTLHEEIAAILAESRNDWMTTGEIADEVNDRDRYHKRDGSLVTAFQIHGRTRNYGHLFDRDGSRVRLRSDARSPVTSGYQAREPRPLPESAPRPAHGTSMTEGTVAAHEIIAQLTDPASRLAASAWPGDLAIDGAGLYTWWTDGAGAKDLRAGLESLVSEGLIYAGQTGGTTVGGVQRVATLRSRIGGNHLRGRIRGSTFRFTLAAALMKPLALVAEGPKRLTAESEAELSKWMRRHLSVCTVLVSDRVAVIRLEGSVLARLDPPLNLDGMPATTLRGQITRLRRELGTGLRMPKRVGLVGCVKEKRGSPAPAKDLYVSPLFVGRRKAVEASCDEWFVLSALHGLVAPTQRLEPYDKTLNSLGRAERRRWSDRVLRALEEQLGSLRGLHFELHAGATYLEFGLQDGLMRRGATVSWPTKGLPMGKQLQYYGRRL